MVSQISAAPVNEAGFECGQLFLIACILRNKWAVGAEKDRTGSLVDHVVRTDNCEWLGSFSRR